MDVEVLTFEEWTYCPSLNTAEGSVLAEGSLQKEQRDSSENCTDEIRDEERACWSNVVHTIKTKKMIDKADQ